VPWRLDTDNIEWIDETYPDRRLDLSGAADLVDALIDAASEDEIDELLDSPLAECRLTDQDAPAIVLDRAGKDL
jgi:hypothetical protein